MHYRTNLKCAVEKFTKTYVILLVFIPKTLVTLPFLHGPALVNRQQSLQLGSYLHFADRDGSDQHWATWCP